MKEMTTEDFHDYGNHFCALISRVRLGMPIEPIQMPDEFFRAKYPERYQHVSYTNTKTLQALQHVIDWFNNQLQKTKSTIISLLKRVGVLLYGNEEHFIVGQTVFNEGDFPSFFLSHRNLKIIPIPLCGI